MKVAAIVVTYNRKVLLQKCIDSLINQTRPPSSIIIIDNASTDNTESWFKSSDYFKKSEFVYIKLDHNSGGAGGFNAGLEFTQKHGFDWAWIMDDDAEPHATALENLLNNPLNSNFIYGSIAAFGENTSWETTLITPEKTKTVNLLKEVPNLSRVIFLPFLGLLISKNTIDIIGLPDKDFFIAGDDLEYCLRAYKNGIEIYVKGNSVIEHPQAKVKKVNFLFFTLDVLDLSPWKNYYNTRNKIIIAKRYHGISLITKTIPGIAARSIYCLLKEPNKIAQLYAIIAGFIDGILGIKGKRHQWWSIKQ